MARQCPASKSSTLMHGQVLKVTSDRSSKSVSATERRDGVRTHNCQNFEASLGAGLCFEGPSDVSPSTAGALLNAETNSSSAAPQVLTVPPASSSQSDGCPRLACRSGHPCSLTGHPCSRHRTPTPAALQAKHMCFDRNLGNPQLGAKQGNPRDTKEQPAAAPKLS